MVLVGLWVQSEPTQLAFNEQKTDDSSVETVSVRPLALSFPFPLSLFLFENFPLERTQMDFGLDEILFRRLVRATNLEAENCFVGLRR